jgi:hypothetical protein
MDLRYPIGPFAAPAAHDPALRREAIEDIAACPDRMREAVAGLSDAQLDTPYRPGGWTVRQVTHHIVDSHLNAYVRFKLALTEVEPTLKTYEEAEWARLPDSTLPVEPSLRMLEALHVRWVHLLRQMSDQDFERSFNHPESGVRRLWWLAALYGWHSRHHVAHVTSLRQREGW